MKVYFCFLRIVDYHSAGMFYRREALRDALRERGYTRKVLQYRAMEQNEPLRNFYHEVSGAVDYLTSYTDRQCSR